MHLDIRNIGGIREGDATLERGINAVQADNWQGKSSFIKAVQTVMGTTGMADGTHPLTEGASEGRVTLDADGDTYTTTLTREGRTVRRSGDTYLTDHQDRECARLFAFLGEDNPIRAAVRNGDDLAALLGRPLELENIDDQIADLRRERNQVETELERAEAAAKRLPDVQESITQLEGDLDDLREEYEALEREREDRDDQSSLRDELSEKRATRNQLEGDITRIENSIDRKETRLAEKRDDLDALDVPDDAAVDVDVDAKRDRIATLRTQVEVLEDVHAANKRVLDEDQFHLVTDVERSIAGDEIACWTCGAAADREDFAARLDALQERIRELRAERESLESEVEAAERRQREVQRKQRKRRTLTSEIEELEADLADARRDLDDRRERLSAVTEEIEELEARVEETDDRLAELQSEITVTERELEAKREEYEKLARQRDDRAALRARYDDLGDEIAALRDRKKTKQRELADQFEAAMQDVIAEFEPGFERARLEPKTNADDEIVDYDLVVARDGREAPRTALSEGELELLGIVTAVAGYKTFNVGERVPVMLLDNVGGLSGNRVKSLVEYLEGEAAYLVTTAYPEAGDFRGHTVSPGAWQVVSDRESAAP